MKKILLLSWFYSTKSFNHDISNMLKTGEASDELKALYVKHSDEIKRLVNKVQEQGSEIITYLDDAYPLLLKNVDFPPWVLCAYGGVEFLKIEVKFAIIGSRRPDPEARYWLHTEMKNLYGGDVVVISGGAIGLDQEAHKAAHANSLKNLCVLPVGICEIYPQSLEPIIRTCVKEKRILVLSQFHPEKKVCKSSFYPRNYLLAALSTKILIVQAALKSGTMVTAKYAMDMGKEIYALPGSPWDERYGGNLKLLDEGAYQMIELNLIHL